MALVTLRILDGADRGRTFEDVPTPLTVGREEGNSVQLDDDRISRFHLKIQEDGGKVVLTDLQSTNGTKVNGEIVHLCLLRPGDVISVGRTLILVGSREEIANGWPSFAAPTSKRPSPSRARIWPIGAIPWSSTTN